MSRGARSALSGSGPVRRIQGMTAVMGDVMRARTDAEDFESWVRPALPAVNRYAGRLVPAEDREDLVQEALERAWRRWSTYNPERGTPTAWLLAIVADRGRRHRTRAAPRTVPVGDQPDLRAARSDVDLERAIARLTPRQQQLVDLYYFVDLDVATVAHVAGCAEGTVRATLHQARARLRELMGDEDG